ncbi:MAG TPA: nucleotidyltransferase domain-containing protein [Roseiarcus sp.]
MSRELDVRTLSEAVIAVHPAIGRLSKLTGADAVLLFGSRARGDYTDESDWDIFVILPDEVELGKFNSVSLWKALADLGIALQVIPVRCSVFEVKRNDINSLSHDAYRDGIVLRGSLAEALREF